MMPNMSMPRNFHSDEVNQQVFKAHLTNAMPFNQQVALNYPEEAKAIGEIPELLLSSLFPDVAFLGPAAREILLLIQEMKEFVDAYPHKAMGGKGGVNPRTSVGFETFRKGLFSNRSVQAERNPNLDETMDKLAYEVLGSSWSGYTDCAGVMNLRTEISDYAKKAQWPCFREGYSLATEVNFVVNAGFSSIAHAYTLRACENFNPGFPKELVATYSSLIRSWETYKKATIS